MSAAAAFARVDELQGMLQSLRTGQVAQRNQAAATASSTAATDASSFAAQLQSASTAQSAASVTPVAGGPSAYDDLIDAAAERNGVDPSLLKGLIRQESNFDPNAGSAAGARGLTQLMPSTAAGLGVTDVTDPAQSIDAGARYLRRQLDAFGGDESKALAAYNAGPNAVKRYGGVPPYAETQDYVKKVLGYAAGYRQAAPASGTTPAAALSSIPLSTNPGQVL